MPFPSPGDLPDRGIEPASPALAGGFFTTEPPGKPILHIPKLKKEARDGKIITQNKVEDSLEEGMAAHTPVFLPGESPWTEDPGRLQSMGLQSQT